MFKCTTNKQYFAGSNSVSCYRDNYDSSEVSVNFFLLAVCRVYLIAQGTTNHSVILCQSICTTSSSLLDEFQSINGQSIVKSCAENFSNSSRGVRSANSEGGQSWTWGPFCDADLTKLRRLDTHHGDMVIQRGTGQ